MRSSFAILIFSIAQIGCGSSYIVSSSSNGERLSFSEFNAAAGREKAKIVFQDDSSLYCQEIVAEPDSTSWLDPTSGIRAAVPTHSIKKIVFTNRIRGALEGAGIGLLAGGGAGFLIGSAIEPPDSKWKGFVTVYFSLSGGGVGLLIGTLVGVAEGHIYEYKFANQSEKP